MRLIDFLVAVLQAHGETLRRLAALLSEEVLLEVLEAAGEQEEKALEKGVKPRITVSQLNPDWFDLPPTAPEPSASFYEELEEAVRVLKLPSVLEFHVWAYSYYRLWIESAMELDAIIHHSPEFSAGVPLVEQAMEESKAWVRALPLPVEIGKSAEQAASVPWLRFRTEVLKRAGASPVRPVH